MSTSGRAGAASPYAIGAGAGPSTLTLADANLTKQAGQPLTLDSALKSAAGVAAWNHAAPGAQPGPYTQAGAAANRTQAADTSGAVATTAATNVTPYGYAQAQANAIPVAINAIEADLSLLRANVRALIADLQATGLIG